MQGKIVDPKNLFEAVGEGDQIVWESREEPLTVYRHVTEEDADGQLATMREIGEESATDLEEEAKYLDRVTNNEINNEVEAGDLLTSSLTGDEFLFVRGPRGGAYIISRWWDKNAYDEWTATIVRYRRNRDGERNSVWEWENVDLCLKVVGHEDVNRDNWHEGLDWAVSEGAGRTVWSQIWTDEDDAERSEYDAEFRNTQTGGGVHTMFGWMCKECRERRPRKDGVCWTCHSDSLPA